MYHLGNSQRGFTLIELLVVIAIIGLLSSVVLASLNTARLKARDARRLSDLRQIQIAFELYFDDNNQYPPQSGGNNGNIGEGAGIDTALAPYMPVVPMDPLGDGIDDENHPYYYYYDGNQLCDDGIPGNIAVIFARNMETQSGNGSDFCTGSSGWGGEGGAGQPEAWHIIIGPSNG